MAITRVGFTGPGAAYQPFAPKEEAGAAAGQTPSASRSRSGGRATWVNSLVWLLVGLGLTRIP